MVCVLASTMLRVLMPALNLHLDLDCVLGTTQRAKFESAFFRNPAQFEQN